MQMQDTLALIAKGLGFATGEVLSKFHRILVRPHLEYSAQFCSLYLRKGMLAMQVLQKRFTKLISRLRDGGNRETIAKQLFKKSP